MIFIPLPPGVYRYSVNIWTGSVNRS